MLRRLRTLDWASPAPWFFTAVAAVFVAFLPLWIMLIRIWLMTLVSAWSEPL
jgi:hypothetical protein